MKGLNKSFIILLSISFLVGLILGIVIFDRIISPRYLVPVNEDFFQNLNQEQTSEQKENNQENDLEENSQTKDDSGSEQEAIEEKQDFCGWSTYSFCSSDKECVVGGCSGQVCQAKGEQIITDCQWKECYKNENYQCKCVENKCQWVEI